MSVKLWGGNRFIPLKQWSFPAGERGVTILDPQDIERYKSFTIQCFFEGSTDIIDIMLLADACRQISQHATLRLMMPYFPFARQDRVTAEGEAFALGVVAKVINSCNFEDIEVWDPHSDVLAALFPAGKLTIRTQWDLMYGPIMNAGFGVGSSLVSPDAGAFKKINKLANKLGDHFGGIQVLQCGKSRDPATGKLSNVKIDTTFNMDWVKDVWVVDDICDGGATFINLAEAFKAEYPEVPMNLAITHGIFSKGQQVLSTHYNKILYLVDLEKKDNV